MLFLTALLLQMVFGGQNNVLVIRLCRTRIASAENDKSNDFDTVFSTDEEFQEYVKSKNIK